MGIIRYAVDLRRTKGKNTLHKAEVKSIGILGGKKGKAKIP